ncbi:MAG: SapC family protein [Pseudomonadota bacterium]
MPKSKGGAGEAALVEGPKVSGSLPLYAEPRAVNSITHKSVALRTGQGDYFFAAKMPLVQVTVDEFERAMLDYPIVFFGDDRQPFVVTSVELEKNQFVSDGEYRTGAYIPAYLRRYPFVFAKDEGSDALILCLDQASNRLAAAGEADTEALFDGDTPTALTQQALSFCESYEGASARTRAFIDLVDELGLLERQSAKYTPPASDTSTLLLEYLTIDRARLDALDAESFQKLRDAQFVGAAYAVAASQAQWMVLPLLQG